MWTGRLWALQMLGGFKLMVQWNEFDLKGSIFAETNNIYLVKWLIWIQKKLNILFVLSYQVIELIETARLQ